VVPLFRALGCVVDAPRNRKRARRSQGGDVEEKATQKEEEGTKKAEKQEEKQEEQAYKEDLEDKPVQKGEGREGTAEAKLPEIAAYTARLKIPPVFPRIPKAKKTRPFA